VTRILARLARCALMGIKHRRLPAYSLTRRDPTHAHAGLRHAGAALLDPLDLHQASRIVPY
jgi:hypothetical protein